MVDVKTFQKIRNFIAVVFLFCITGLHSLPLEQLVGTYDFLPADKKYLSPLSGAIWWESGTLKNYFDFGVKNPIKGVTVEDDATIQLMHQLFHVVGGYFNVTRNASYPAQHMSAKTVGKIMRAIEESREAGPEALKEWLTTIFSDVDGDFQKSVQETVSLSKKLLKDLDKVNKEEERAKKAMFAQLLAELKIINEPLKVDFENLLPKNFSEITPDVQETVIKRLKEQNPEEPKKQLRYKKFIAQFNEKFAMLPDFIRKSAADEQGRAGILKQLSKNDGQKLQARITKGLLDRSGVLIEKSLIDLIPESLVECGYFNYDASKTYMYVPYMTQSLFSAFLYYRAENRQELLDYFNELGLLPPAVEQDQQAWLDQQFDKLSINKIIAGLEGQQERSLEEIFNGGISEEQILAELFDQYRSTTLPPFSNYVSNVSVPGFSSITFPDCMETTIMNCYNSFRGGEIKGVESKKTHNEWVERVANIPFCVYGGIIEKNTGRYIPQLTGLGIENYEGFIYGPPAPQEQTEFVNVLGEQMPIMRAHGKKYILVDQDKYYLYELRPSLYNLIVLLNRLMNTELYQAQDHEQEWAILSQENFVSNHFDALWEKLGWSRDRAGGMSLDSARSIQFTLTKENDQFILQIHPGHGVAMPQKAVLKRYRDIFRLKIFTKIMNFKGQSHTEDDAQYITDVGMLYHPQTIEIIDRVSYPWKLFCLFSKTLLDKDKAEIGKQVLESNEVMLLHLAAQWAMNTVLANRNISDLLFARISSIQEISKKNMLFSSILGVALQAFFHEIIFAGYDMRTVHMLSNNLINRILKHNQGFEQVTLVAMESVKSAHVTTYCTGLELFINLVRYGKQLEQAILVATEAVKSIYPEIQWTGNMLFMELVNNDQAFEQAIVAASESVKSTNEGVYRSGLELFSCILKKNRGLHEATIAAIAAMRNTDSRIKNLGLPLLKQIVKKKYGFVQAIILATELVMAPYTRSNVSSYNLGQELFSEILMKTEGSSFFQIAQAFKSFSSNMDWNYDYFSMLFSGNTEYKEITIAAAEAMKSSLPALHTVGLFLFAKLVEKGQGFKEATEAASEAVKNADELIRRDGFDLFKALFERNQGFKEAAEAAAQAVQHRDEEIRKLGFSLFGELFARNQGFVQGIEAGCATMKSPYFLINWVAPHLFKLLVEYGKGFKEAAEVGQWAVKNSDAKMRTVGSDLLKKLSEKGYKFEERDQGAVEPAKHVSASELSEFAKQVEQGQGFEQAADAAAEAVQSTDRSIRYPGRDLFRALFKRNAGFKQAEQAASRAVQNTDVDVHASGLGLFEELVQKGHALEKAAQAAAIANRSTDYLLKSKGDSLQSLIDTVKEKAKSDDLDRWWGNILGDDLMKK